MITVDGRVFLSPTVKLKSHGQTEEVSSLSLCGTNTHVRLTEQCSNVGMGDQKTEERWTKAGTVRDTVRRKHCPRNKSLDNGSQL